MDYLYWLGLPLPWLLESFPNEILADTAFLSLDGPITSFPLEQNETRQVCFCTFVGHCATNISHHSFAYHIQFCGFTCCKTGEKTSTNLFQESEIKIWGSFIQKTSIHPEDSFQSLSLLMVQLFFFLEISGEQEVACIQNNKQSSNGCGTAKI